MHDLTTLQALLPNGSLTCDLSDSSDAVTVLPLVFAWRGSETPFLGPAHTVTAPDGDLGAVFEGVRTAEPGCVVIVATGETERAIWGETTTRQALQRGVAGVILDGACRDVKAVRASGLPVVGRGVSPKRAERTNRGEVGNTLRLHGITVHSGDLIVSDENGTVVVPSALVDQVVETISSTNQEVDSETDR